MTGLFALMQSESEVYPVYGSRWRGRGSGDYRRTMSRQVNPAGAAAREKVTWPQQWKQANTAGRDGLGLPWLLCVCVCGSPPFILFLKIIRRGNWSTGISRRCRSREPESICLVRGRRGGGGSEGEEKDEKGGREE